MAIKRSSAWKDVHGATPVVIASVPVSAGKKYLLMATVMSVAPGGAGRSLLTCGIGVTNNYGVTGEMSIGGDASAGGDYLSMTLAGPWTGGAGTASLRCYDNGPIGTPPSYSYVVDGTQIIATEVGDITLATQS